MTQPKPVFGNKGGGHTPTEKANTLFSTATARVVDLISEGEIEGPVDADFPERSVFFDNVPVMEDEMIEGITSITASTRLFTVASLPSGFVAGRSIRVSGCANTGNNGDFTIEAVNTVTAGSVYTIKVKKGDEVKLTNETPPVAAAINLMNFKGIQFEFRTGTPDQTPLTGISEVENERELNREVKFGFPVDFQITNDDIDDVKVTLRFQALQKQTDKGDVVGSTVEFKFLRKWVGGSFVEFDAKKITGKTSSEYEIQYRIPIKGEPLLQGQPVGLFPLTIRIDRTTPDSDSASKQDAFSVLSYTEVQNLRLQYPNSAIAGIKVNAELFGGRVPDRSYFIKGIKIKYPTGYNPETQEYPEFWDGTFTVGWCDNPAWVFYDILTNARYGLGEFISEAQVDKEALYQIAKYCDCWDDETQTQVLIPDGYGGLERRFVFNGVIEQRQEAFTVLSALASVFRGMSYWSAGGVTASQDSPKSSTRLVARANVIGGDFTYSGTALKARHTAALVTWNDPEDNYKQAVEVIEDQDLIVRYGWRPIEVVAFATTNRGQAHRVGRWILDSEKYETETITFTGGEDFHNCRPGEVIEVSDPTRTGVRRGGRILSYADYSGGGTIVYIDMPYQTVDGDILLVMNTEDQVEELDIVAGTYGNYLILSESPAGTLQPDAVYVIQGTNTVPEKWRVMSMREVERHQFEITALSYDENKFDRVEQDILLSEKPTSFLPTGKLSPPTNLTMVESLVRKNNFVSTVLDISWSPSSDPRTLLYQVEYKPPGSEWSAPVYTSGVTFQITEANPSYYDDEEGEFKYWDFRVRAQKTYTAAAEQSDPLELLNQTVVGKTAKPADVENFTNTRDYHSVYLSWDIVSDIDLVGYDIRQGTEWESATVIAEGHVSNRLVVKAETQDSLTFLIRSRDDSGFISQNVSQTTATFPGLPDLSDLRAYQIGSTVKLIWTAGTGSVAFGFEVRQGYPSNTWDESLPIGETSTTQFIAPVSVGVTTTFRYYVRLFIEWSDGKRGYGAEHYVEIDKWPIVGSNLVLTREEHTLNWPGTLSAEMEVVSNELRLKDGETFGIYEYSVDLGSVKTGRFFKRDVGYFEVINTLLIHDATMLIHDATFPIRSVSNSGGVANVRYFLEFTPEIEFEEADYEFQTVTVRVEFRRNPTDDFRPVLSELVTYFNEPTEMQ